MFSAANTSIILGCCPKTQGRAGEATLLLGKQPDAHRHIAMRRLLSSRLVRLVHRRASRVQAWVRTYRLEIGSLLARIRYIQKKDLVGRYEMGPACLSCRKRGMPQRCKETQAYIQYMQQLHSLHPWLSYSDSNLLLEGWVLVLQSRLSSLDCGMAGDLKVADSSECRNSTLPLTTQQSTTHDPLNPLPSRE